MKVRYFSIDGKPVSKELWMRAFKDRIPAMVAGVSLFLLRLYFLYYLWSHGQTNAVVAYILVSLIHRANVKGYKEKAKKYWE